MAFRSKLDPQPLLHLDGVLPDDEVHVWYAQLKSWEKQTDSLLDLLNAEERQRAARFKFPAPRKQFVISRALLRQAVGRYLNLEARDIRFRTTANGKPEFAGKSDLRFNLSHAEGVTTLAFTRNRQVGIDVERIKQNTEAMELAARFFSPQEVQWLRSQPASEHIPSFFSCWTAKEAYIKANGQGLSMPLAGFSVLPSPGTSRLQLQVNGDLRESARWSLWRLDLGPGLRAALAIEGEIAKLRLGQWPELSIEPR